MILTYQDFYCKEEVKLSIAHYQNNGNLAIQMICVNGEYENEPFAFLTVNLNEKLPENCAYIDINNLRQAFDFCLLNKLAEFDYSFKQSGYCSYPLMRFNMDEIKKYC